MDPERLSTLTAQYREQGALTDAIRLVCLAARTDQGPTATAREFLARYPRAVSVSWVRQSLDDLAEKAVPPLDTATGAALLPPANLDPLVNKLQQATILARIPGLQRVPVKVPVPTESAAPSLQWAGQGAPKPVSQLTLGNVTLPLCKFAGILTYTEELARLTPGTESVIERRLRAASTRFLDKSFLDPALAAVADKNPASVTNGLTPVAAGPTLDDTVEALTNAFFTARPEAELPTFILSPRVASKLAGPSNSDLRTNEPGLLKGTPTVITPGAGNNLVLLDAEGVYYADDGAQVDVSRFASVEAEAAPTNPPTAATVMVDLWSRNLIGVRLDRFVSWAREANAVAYTVIA